ncbi:MAG: hypothetical protein KF850_10325 [Labilithrix sp.]|nr:hypothetical protein [Labilithrix sp.]
MSALSCARPSYRSGAVAFVVLWLGLSGGILLIPGCYGRNCEGATETFGDEPGEGQLVTENTWESSPSDGDWLWFPRQRVYSFNIPALSGRTPLLPHAFISASPAPNRQGGEFTSGAGSPVVFFAQRPNGIAVKNDTCTDYFLRVVLELPPFPPAAPDGGLAKPEVDAGAADGAEQADGGR